MKKLMHWFKKVVIVCLVLTVVFVASVFAYHRYQLNVESDLIQPKGTVVEVDNKKLNIYSEGKGEETFVFMPGSGIAAPVYEMKGLYTKFSKDNKIAVVDRAGYGSSDVFDDGRDIDTILEQTRKSLKLSGLKPPYILVPHSLSGLEAMYWAQKYPEEIKGIIALDIGLPQEYASFKFGFIETAWIKGMSLITKLGMHRIFSEDVYDREVINQSFLTNKEKEIFKAISFKQVFNEDMRDELLQSHDNGKKSVNLPLPKHTPILFLAAYTEENKNSIYTIQQHKNYEELAGKLTYSKVVKVKGKHSLYLYAPDTTYQQAIEFMFQQ